ncbi:adenosine deaminase [Vibrio harveyi]
MDIQSIPKAILHEHIEGSVTPKVAKKLAAKYNVELSEDFFYSAGSYDISDFPNGRYKYDESNFDDFINTYDTVAGLVREPSDYYLIVKDFLSRNSKSGMLYCEIITSAFHLCFDHKTKTLSNKKYHDIMDEIDRAIEEIYYEFGTITRLQACGVRHIPKHYFNMSIDFIEQNPRSSITGFNIAGNEMVGAFSEFNEAHNTIDRIGLKKSYHAGEICDSQSIVAAIKSGAIRIGHGIRAIDDERLIDTLIANNILLEISLTSNRILVQELKQCLSNHPLRVLYDKGVRISINTDDAGLFGTDIDKEYKIAVEHFGFKRVELFDITLCAIEAAFIPQEERQQLLSLVYNRFTTEDVLELEKLCNKLSVGPLKKRLLERLSFITEG